MKVLVTGSGGFVACHLRRAFVAHGAEVYGVDRAEGEGVERALDLMDKESLKGLLKELLPNAIVHLAAVSSVGQSWKTPVESFMNNTNIFLNLVESVRELGLKTRILSVGSSEEYGNYGESEMPLREDHELKPISPYAIARVAQEMISRLYAESYGLDIVMTRSFNHIGPGQRRQFVVSSFVHQLVEAKKKGCRAELLVGDLSIIRDFTDVRDVVEAYWLLLMKGKSGRVYNICSGEGHALREIVTMIAAELRMEVGIRVDANLIRPADNSVIVGDNTRVRAELGWLCRHDLKDSIRTMIESVST